MYLQDCTSCVEGSINFSPENMVAYICILGGVVSGHNSTIYENSPNISLTFSNRKDFQNEITVGYSEVSEGITDVIHIYPTGSYSVRKGGKKFVSDFS